MSSDDHGDFEKATDPKERERILDLLNDSEDVIELDLDEGETATLPSGTKVERTEDGFTILHN